jgi:hypothetical protein
MSRALAPMLAALSGRTRTTRTRAICRGLGACGGVVSPTVRLGPVAEETAHTGLLLAVLDQENSETRLVGVGHLDELKPASRGEGLGAQGLALGMPPGHAAAGLEQPLAPGPGETDRQGLILGQRLGSLDEHPGEPDIDHERLFLCLASQERGPTDEGNSELTENALRG